MSGFLWIYPKGLIPLVVNECIREREEWMKRLKHIKLDWRQNVTVKKSGFDYEETFSPVAMIKSIRILLLLATYYDYEI